MAIDTQKEQFVRAYDELADSLFRHCYYRISNRDIAKDLLQETFTKTWEYITKGNKVDNLKSFLYRAANNLIIDEYRKKKSLSLDALQDEGFDMPSRDATQDIVRNAEGQNVLKTLDLLDTKYREVVVMRYVDGMSPREIADILGDTENSVSVRLSRALDKVRQLLQV